MESEGYSYINDVTEGSVENSYADANYIAVFGESSAKPVAENPLDGSATVPTQWDIANFPNPFNPSTCIHFQLPADAQVEMAIYNIRGQLVIELVDEFLKTGYYSIAWDGKHNNGNPLGSGIYLAQMVVKPIHDRSIQVLTHRLVLLK